jgi:hypothetical protein
LLGNGVFQELDATQPQSTQVSYWVFDHPFTTSADLAREYFVKRSNEEIGLLCRIPGSNVLPVQPEEGNMGNLWHIVDGITQESMSKKRNKANPAPPPARGKKAQAAAAKAQGNDPSQQASGSGQGNGLAIIEEEENEWMEEQDAWDGAEMDDGEDEE